MCYNLYTIYHGSIYQGQYDIPTPPPDFIHDFPASLFDNYHIRAALFYAGIFRFKINADVAHLDPAIKHPITFRFRDGREHAATHYPTSTQPEEGSLHFYYAVEPGAFQGHLQLGPRNRGYSALPHTVVIYNAVINFDDTILLFPTSHRHTEEEIAAGIDTLPHIPVHCPISTSGPGISPDYCQCCGAYNSLNKVVTLDCGGKVFIPHDPPCCPMPDDIRFSEAAFIRDEYAALVAQQRALEKEAKARAEESKRVAAARAALVQEAMESSTRMAAFLLASSTSPSLLPSSSASSSSFPSSSHSTTSSAPTHAAEFPFLQSRVREQPATPIHTKPRGTTYLASLTTHPAPATPRAIAEAAPLKPPTVGVDFDIVISKGRASGPFSVRKSRNPDGNRSSSVSHS